MRLLGERTLEVSQPASEEVYRKLRDMIFSGELQHDEHLVERRLAEMLLVSRTPVREALRKLEAEGLVKREPYRGLVVAEFTPEDFIEVLEIREVLEGLATQLAAANKAGDHLAELGILLAQMEQCLNAGEDFANLHLRFHNTIYLAAKRPRLYNLISSVQEHTEAFPRIGYKMAGRGKQALEEHKEIYQRISVGDAVAAGEIARIHIRHAKDALLAVLEKNEGKVHTV